MKTLKTLQKYLITFCIGFIIVDLVFWLRISQPDTFNVFHNLSDAFFTAGVLITGAGALTFATNEGGFDILAYGMSSFMDIFRKKDKKKKYESLYDYKESRAGKKWQFGFLLISGVIFLAVSGIMLWCTYNCI